MTAAAPIPQPEPEPAPDQDDGWLLLDSLRRRLDDQTAQTRRTQDQVSQLAESIAALVAIQRRRSRWLNLNSFVAYLIFTILVGAGFLFLYHSRANELVESRETATTERDAAVRRADDAAAKAAARDKAEAQAWEVYQLLEQGKRQDASSRLAKLRDLPLSRTERAVVADRAQQSQVMEVDAALKAAVAAVKAGRFADVIAPLESALKTEPASTMRAAQMHYYLGIAYAKGTASPADLDKSTSHLQAAVNADVDQEDARFQLASVLDRNGAYAKARTEYDKFATAHPQSQLAAFAMRRSATLARMPPTAPVVPGKALPVAPPTGAAPTPNVTPAAPKLVTPPPAAPKAAPPTTPNPAQPATGTAPQPVAPTSPSTSPSQTPPVVTPPGATNAAPPPATGPPATSPFSLNPPTNATSMAVLDGPPAPPVSGPDHKTRRLRPKSPSEPSPPAPTKPEPSDPETPAPLPSPPSPSPAPVQPTPHVDAPPPARDEPTKPAPPPTREEPTKPAPPPTREEPTKPAPPRQRDGIADGRPRPTLPVTPRDGITDKPLQPALPLVPRDGIADEPTPPGPTSPSPAKPTAADR